MMQFKIGPPSADIKSVSEAIDLLAYDTAIKDVRPTNQPKRGDTDFGLWFRRHSSESHVLVPSVLRESLAQTGRYLDEVSMVRHFKAMNCDVVPSDATDFEVLVTMQHYLAPTRLLDWTENLLVALHFAVRDPENDDKNGALWLLNARRLNYYTSVSSRRSEVLFESELDVLARSSLIRVRNRQEWVDVLNRLRRTSMIDKEEYRIDRVLLAIKKIKLLGEQVNDALASPVDLRDLLMVNRDEVIQKDLPPSWATPERLDVRLRSPVAIYPNRANRRIRAQSGCFTVHGGKFMPNPKDYAKGKLYSTPIGLPISLHEIQHSLRLKRVQILKWFRIPSGSQSEIRRTLARIGITDASLFPELDYQSRYLHKRWTSEQAEPEEE
jgi:FRG domain